MPREPGLAQVWSPGYNAILKRLLATKGDDPLKDVLDQLLPALILENDRPEWHFLRDSHLFAGFYTPGAAIGKLSAVQFKVTAGSGIIATIVGCGVQNPLAGAYSCTRGATRLAGGTGAVLRDSRYPVARLSNLVGVIDNSTFAALNGTQFESHNIPAGLAGDDFQFVTTPWVIADSAANQDTVTVFGNTANQALQVLVWGYERSAEQTELPG